MTRFASLGLSLICALFTGAVQAASYQFTGPTYSSVSNYTPPCAQGDCADYTVAMQPRGWFSYLGSLAPNLAGHNLHADPNLMSYGFSDGLTAMESSQAGSRLVNFQVWTDATGNLVGWLVNVQQWQDNLAGPHPVDSRLNILALSSASSSTNYHNLSCGIVGPAVPSGVADACQLFGVSASSSSADHSNAGAAWGDVPSLTVNSVSGFEGNAGVTNFNFTIQLDQAPTAPVSVDVRLLGGSATAGSDFIDPGVTTLSWGIGDASSRTVTVQVLGDTAAEPDETFTIRLTNVAGAGIVDPNGTGTILNDDAPPPAGVTSVPTLSEWALLLLAGLLGLFGARRFG